MRAGPRGELELDQFLAFAPGQNVAVYSTAEACVFDVRSGLGLGCKRGFGKAEKNYVKSPDVNGYYALLAGEAMGGAVRDLPRELNSVIPAATAS